MLFRSLVAYSKGEIRQLAVPSSVEPWSEERVEEEARRIREHPTRLDRLRAFSGFVEGESYPLRDFGRRPGFVIQHAYNHATGGPVHERAEAQVSALDVPVLLRRWPKDACYNPKPALLRTLEGHTWGVTGVSMTPDGRSAVSGSRDKTLRVWDLVTGRCLFTLEGHTDSVNSVSVTPDGRRAVSGSRDKTIRVWDLVTRRCLRALEGHTRYINGVSVTPDGRRAVSVSDAQDSRPLWVWDLETGACLGILEVTNWIWGVSVSLTPDGRRAVSACADDRLRVWDLEAGAWVRTLGGHTNWVTGVSMTPDGQRVVSGSWDKTLRMWDVETGTCLRVLEGHIRSVESVSLTADDHPLLRWLPACARPTGLRVIVGLLS